MFEIVQIVAKPAIAETSFEKTNYEAAVFSVLSHNEKPKKESEKLSKATESISKYPLKELNRELWLA